METKKCTKCKLILPITDFHKRGGKEKGYRSLCKSCSNKNSSLWYSKNKVYYNERKSIYRKNNRNLINTTYNKYYISRMSNDSIFKMTRNIRSLIRASFKRAVNSKYKKSKKTEEILGCSIDYFLTYISSKFKEGMTFDNHGEWHIDHIIPISTAKTEVEIIKLNHYTNLQPLWAKDNLIKKNN